LKQFASRESGFSLVEVVLALAILAFSLVTIAALLPIGLKSNQTSVEESRAADLLALLDSDLRNTYPVLSSDGKTCLSQVLGLSTPYTTASGRTVLNGNLTAATYTAFPTVGTYTVGVTDKESPVAIGSVQPAPPYEASVVYTGFTTTPSSTGTANYTGIQARLVISWPAINSTKASITPAQLTQGRGYLEAFVTFPAP
jgi:uncharacterized protein (TIGR02598 family)